MTQVSTNGILANERMGEIEVEPTTHKLLLHTKSYSFDQLSHATLLRVHSLKGCIVLADRENIEIKPKETVYIFACQCPSVQFNQIRGLLDIFTVGYPREWISKALEENTPILGAVPSLEYGAMSLGKGSEWLRAILNRYEFERLTSATSQVRCAFFLEKQILNEVFNMLFKQDDLRPKRNPASMGEASEKTNSIAEKARAWALANTYKKLELDELCRQLAVSRSTVTRLFQQTNNQTLSEFHNECKLRKADYLLRATSLSTNDIAHLLGYSDVVSFRHAFKRFFGHSPRSAR